VLAQLPSIPGDVDANVHALVACVARYAGHADLVVAPECFVAGYGPQVSAAAAEPADGPTLQRVARAARAARLAVVYGFSELAEDG
jgi:predicted amidohydrolase